jgi:hypothetical protein
MLKEFYKCVDILSFRVLAQEYHYLPIAVYLHSKQQKRREGDVNKTYNNACGFFKTVAVYLKETFYPRAIL